MLSHQFTRPFQPDRIRHPRDFQPLAATFWQQPAIFLEIGAGKGKHALSFASNIESYIDEAEHKAQTVWQVPVEKTHVPNHSERTHFEVKYLARGEACWQLSIKKPHGYTTRFDDFNSF